METKKWYQSKMVWTNLSLIGGAIAGYFQMELGLQEALMVAIPAIVNVGLRLITGKPIKG